MKDVRDNKTRTRDEFIRELDSIMSDKRRSIVLSALIRAGFEVQQAEDGIQDAYLYLKKSDIIVYGNIFVYFINLAKNRTRDVIRKSYATKFTSVEDKRVRHMSSTMSIDGSVEDDDGNEVIGHQILSDVNVEEEVLANTLKKEIMEFAMKNDLTELYDFISSENCDTLSFNSFCRQAYNIKESTTKSRTSRMREKLSVFLRNKKWN